MTERDYMPRSLGLCMFCRQAVWKEEQFGYIGTVVHHTRCFQSDDIAMQVESEYYDYKSWAEGRRAKMNFGVERHEAERWVKAATREGEFVCSEGRVDRYIDMYHVMALNQARARKWHNYFAYRCKGYWPVGPGRSGSLIIGLLGYGTVCNLDKEYGLEWCGAMPKPGSSVVLVDDISVTGVTLGRLWLKCNEQGLKVVGSVVGFPWQYPDQTVAHSLKKLAD